MQKSQGAENGGESCQVKVNIEFIENSADPNNSILLAQFPQDREQLQLACDQMPSEAAANHEREQKVKYLS